MNSILKIENMTKNFGKFEALKNINFEIKQGEVVGYIGPNGAGKSTTIRTILGIYQPTKGKVSVFGKDAWKDAVEIHKRIAYVPGDVSLWPNLTGGEIIDLFMNLRGGGDQKRRAELIEKFQLDPRKKARTYSKGNRQKVALIAAFATDADLYIFDEPTSGLDPLMESVFHEYVLEAKAKGKSIMLSSHILSEVEKLCDRVAIIREGAIIEDGSLDELRHLTQTNIKVKTSQPLSIDGVTGIQSVSEESGGYFNLTADTKHIGEIMSHLSTFGIVDIQTAPPSLEEMFMRHYEGGVH